MRTRLPFSSVKVRSENYSSYVRFSDQVVWQALWHLFYNGRKPPLLRPVRYSVKRMRDLPSRFNKAAQEQVLHEAENFLLSSLDNMAERKDDD